MRSCAIGAAIGVVALLYFGWDLSAEPRFADESAFLSQAYYCDLWLKGDYQNAAWLTFPALDLVPLPKYLIGLSLRAASLPRPGPAAAMRWYSDISYQCGTAAMLGAARWPSAVLGALGCVALYALGLQAGGRHVGVIAALLLMANPLYRMHARRAMADVPAEALVLITAALGLWCWRRTLSRGWGAGPAFATLGTGIAGGLAVLAKLNGVLGLLIVSAWACLAVLLPGVRASRKVALFGAALAACVLGFLTFVALNPFLTAQATGTNSPALRQLRDLGFLARCDKLRTHRLDVAANQQQNFPSNALTTPLERACVVAEQGFGRFGPFGPSPDDSTIRYDWQQDWGAWIWRIWVGIGLVWAIVKGYQQMRTGAPPAAWAIALEALVALVVVTLYIPMAWNRYFLSIQPGSALLAAGAVVWVCEGLLSLAARQQEPNPVP
ncbi:MAG TPA: glycosyltransferase family 39 protein [Isosphaeraceae bacterium]|nr:glycosyltransferase family 39 protein [Isosphaeraceae bacterium]